MPAHYLGVVNYSKTNEFTVAALNNTDQQARTESFDIQRQSYADAQQAMNTRRSYPPDMIGLSTFLRNVVDDPFETQVAVEIQSIAHEAHSPLLKVLLLLNKEGYCTNTFYELERGYVGISVLPPELRQVIEQQTYAMLDSASKQGVESRGGRVLPYDTKFLGAGVSKAYAGFLAKRDASVKDSAIGLALIGAREPIHRYLFSSGRVQSSQDVVYFLEHRQIDHTVHSGGHKFIQKRVEETVLTEWDKIPLKYAVETTKHASLGEREAQKMALLAVSRRWKIELYCKDRNSSFEPDDPNDLVYSPKVESETWLFGSDTHSG